MLSDIEIDKLRRLAEEAFWCINEPYEKLLIEIGKELIKLFPDKGRRVLLIWKNRDAKPLAQPFIEGLHCLECAAYTQRLIKGRRVIKNEQELKKWLSEQQREMQVDAIVFLDCVAGTCGTALAVYKMICDIFPTPPRFYFYCIFGSHGVEDMMKKVVSDPPPLVLTKYPMIENIDPPRLEWFVMSDLGDRLPERTKDTGLLIETPVEDEREIIKKRLDEVDLRLRNREVPFTGDLHTIKIRQKTLNTALIAGAFFVLQKEKRHHSYKNDLRYARGDYIPYQLMMKAVNKALSASQPIKEHVGELEERNGILQNAFIRSETDWLVDHGYLDRGPLGDEYKLPNNFLQFFYSAFYPNLKERDWFAAMEASAYNLLTER
ncbi:MAG: hypothetical protein AB1485_05750 [Candidatus Thermoplasmatota archaeon]